MRAVAPYAQRLRLFPAFLQQLEMESNGKRVSAGGRPVERDAITRRSELTRLAEAILAACGDKTGRQPDRQ